MYRRAVLIHQKVFPIQHLYGLGLIGSIQSAHRVYMTGFVALIYIRNLSVSYTATIIIILLHIDLPLYFSVVDWIGLVYGV